MSSSYTALGFVLQETGENETVWGDTLNASALSLIDAAIRGRVAFALSGSKTLTSTNGVDTEGRKAILHATSGTGGTVTIPGYSKAYFVINDTTGAVVVTSGGADNATFEAGDSGLAVCDGAGAVRKIQSNDFAGSVLTNVGSPTSDYNAATKKYVDDTAFAASSGTFPGLTGNALKFLRVKADETGPEWALVIQRAARKTANYTAVSGDRLQCDTTAGTFTVTAPASPSVGDRFIVFDGGNTASSGGFSTNKLNVARNGSTFNGSSDDIEMTTKGLSLAFECVAANQWWVSNGN